MYEIFEKLCNEKGITPYRVCKETGITTATISNWKAGRYTPKQDKMQKIAEFLGVTIEYLMTGKEKDINLTCNGMEGFQLLLADIYGSCKMEGIMGKYGECLYFSIGVGKNKYALEENDFDRLYNSVRKTVQQMTNLLLKSETVVRHECLVEANTPLPTEKSVITKDYLAPNAAHDRTGIKIKEEERLDDESMID